MSLRSLNGPSVEPDFLEECQKMHDVKLLFEKCKGTGSKSNAGPLTDVTGLCEAKHLYFYTAFGCLVLTFLRIPWHKTRSGHTRSFPS